jgi:hypothetical protein
MSRHMVNAWAALQPGHELTKFSYMSPPLRPMDVEI